MADPRKFLFRLVYGGIDRFWIDKETGLLLQSGGVRFSVASITNADTPYSATEGDYTILADATDGAITVTLPAIADQSGRILNIKKTDSTPNIVTLDGDGSETIDGETTIGITNQYESLTVQAGSDGWYII